jgi:hypothetical protein
LILPIIISYLGIPPTLSLSLSEHVLFSDLALFLTEIIRC